MGAITGFNGRDLIDDELAHIVRKDLIEIRRKQLKSEGSGD